VRQLLSLLPQSAMHAAPRADPVAPLREDPSGSVPQEPSRVYDIRHVIEALADGGAFLELCPRWARNMVIGLARVDGRPVGFVANQPRHLGGVIDVAASAKASRFITTCDAFGLPLIVLVDTPGFMPGTKQEDQAIIRQGAGLLRAFAEASVRKLTVVIRKAYGGGFIAMNSKDLGADLTLAWPGATLGVLGARQAVKIIHGREIGEAAESLHELDRRAALYAAQHESPLAAARAGLIDDVIHPTETRVRLCRALMPSRPTEHSHEASPGDTWRLDAITRASTSV
jgi:acetyl-CoA carboxylase carboxyltransferase component